MDNKDEIPCCLTCVKYVEHERVISAKEREIKQGKGIGNGLALRSGGQAKPD